MTQDINKRTKNRKTLDLTYLRRNRLKRSDKKGKKQGLFRFFKTLIYSI